MTEEKQNNNQEEKSGQSVTPAVQVAGEISKKTEKKRSDSFSNRKNREQRRGRPQREDDGFDQKIVHIARVTRVMAGGKRMRFRACVAVGDKKSKVGIGIGKSADVTTAISKATEQAKKNLVNVQLINDTIAHEVSYKFGAARIMMKPAPAGRGIIAGGAMRLVLELAGIHNVVGKIQGSSNKVNIVKCVIEALKNLKKIEINKETEKKKENFKK